MVVKSKMVGLVNPKTGGITMISTLRAAQGIRAKTISNYLRGAIAHRVLQEWQLVPTTLGPNSQLAT